MENPFLVPPGVEGAQSRSWGLGFSWGFQGPALSSMTTEALPIEDADAFDLGVLAGQKVAIEGIPLDSPCIGLNVEHPALLSWSNENEVIEAVGIIAGAGKTAFELVKHAAGAAFSGALLLVELAVGLETFSEDPQTELTQRASVLAQQLVDLGFTEPMGYFLGGGVDLSSTGCELMMTSIFKNLDDARTAAQNSGRTGWLVVSWQNNQSGGVKMVASSAM